MFEKLLYVAAMGGANNDRLSTARYNSRSEEANWSRLSCVCCEDLELQNVKLCSSRPASQCGLRLTTATASDVAAPIIAPSRLHPGHMLTVTSCPFQTLDCHRPSHPQFVLNVA